MALPSVVALLTVAASGYVDRGDYRIHFESMGSGAPAVAIAGGPGFSGRAVWSYGFEMRDVSQVILFDQLGTGKSRPKAVTAKPNLSLNGTIADLEALRKHLGFKKWTVFGQSWGTIVAIAYAAKHPERVDRLVLASIPGFHEVDYQILSTNLAVKAGPMYSEILAEARKGTTPADVAARQVFGFTPYYFMDTELGFALSKKARPEMFDGDTFIRLYDEISDDNFRAIKRDIKRWKGKALIVQGHQDPCGATMGYELAQWLPNSELRMINSAGHFTFLEYPYAFFPSVRSFLGLAAAPHYRYISGEEVDAWEKKRDEAGWPFGFIDSVGDK